jgi:putative membrane protein
MSLLTTLLRQFLIVILVLILVPFGMMAVITPMVGMWDGNHIWTGGMAPVTGPGWMWPLLWFVLLVLIVGFSYFLYKSLSGSDSQETDIAIQEVRIAYARGELSDEEFETRLERLRREK